MVDAAAKPAPAFAVAPSRGLPKVPNELPLGAPDG